MRNKRVVMQIDTDAVLSTQDIFMINCQLAEEIIEQRLAAVVSIANIEHLARCISDLEE